jgi:hypothetical protein
MIADRGIVEEYSFVALSEQNIIFKFQKVVIILRK